MNGALRQLADIAVWTSQYYPQVTTVDIDTTSYYDAGATDACELAIAMATALVYVRAMLKAGLPIDTCCQQISFSLSVGCEEFLSAAKLRAARSMWKHIGQILGASPSAQSIHINAVPALRKMPECDSWINTLRNTIAVFSANIAQVDSITLIPCKTAFNLKNHLSWKIANNTFLKPMELSKKRYNSCHPIRYIDKLTDIVEQMAWKEFQSIERSGGLPVILSNGKLISRIEKQWKKSSTKNGLNTNELIKLLNEQYISFNKNVTFNNVIPYNRKSNISFERMIYLANKDYNLHQLNDVLNQNAEPFTVAPLPQHRMTESFEFLRNTALSFGRISLYANEWLESSQDEKLAEDRFLAHTVSVKRHRISRLSSRMPEYSDSCF